MAALHFFLTVSEMVGLKDSLNPSFLRAYSALIDQMAQSVLIGLPLMVLETKHPLQYQNFSSGNFFSTCMW